MNITNKEINKYLFRIKPLPTEYKQLIGKILKPIGVEQNLIVFEVVDSFEDTNFIAKLPLNFARDNGWHDITDLVYEANACIYPRLDDFEFGGPIQMAYRSVLPNIDDYKLSEEQAVGKVVFRGKPNNNGGVDLHSVGYYVAEFDADGFAITFYGYGRTMEEGGSSITPELKVIRVRGTAVNLYDARLVIDTCNTLYAEDIKSATGFLEKSIEEINVQDTALNNNGAIRSAKVRAMSLE